MCLAIPAKITELKDGNLATVDILGVTRDIAVVCDASVPVGELTECIRKAEKNVLRGVKLFDVYTGVGIPEGKKSVAFSLTLRSDDGTLTDDHAEEAVRAVLDALRENFGAVIR